MVGKRRYICGLVGAGARSTGPAGKRSTLGERSLASHPDRMKSVAVRRVRPSPAAKRCRARRALYRSRARHSTSAFLAKCVWRSSTGRAYGSRAGDTCGGRRGRHGPGMGGEYAAGMDISCNGIFPGSRMAVMESVRHAAARGRAAGGRTMSERGACEAWSSGTARQGPGGRSVAASGAVRSAFRWRMWPVDTTWHGPPNGDSGWLAGAKRGCCGAHSARRACPWATNHGETTACARIRALRDGSAQVRLARDNYCYREPNRRFKPSRPVPGKPPGRVPASVGGSAP